MFTSNLTILMLIHTCDTECAVLCVCVCVCVCHPMIRVQRHIIIPLRLQNRILGWWVHNEFVIRRKAISPRSLGALMTRRSSFHFCQTASGKSSFMSVPFRALALLRTSSLSLYSRNSATMGLGLIEDEDGFPVLWACSNSILQWSICSFSDSSFFSLSSQSDHFSLTDSLMPSLMRLFL